MNEIIKNFNKETATKWEKKVIKIICYADNAIIPKSDMIHEYYLKLFKEIAIQFNMINSTEEPKLSAVLIRCKLVVNNKIIQQMMKMNYLESKKSIAMEEWKMR